MKKTILSVAVILASIFSFNSFAQNPEVEVVEAAIETISPDAQQAAPQKQKAKKGQKADFKAKKGQKDGQCCKDGKQKGQRPDMFAGLNLTADQQSALEALIPQRPEGQKPAKEGKQAKDNNAKADKSKADKQAKGQKGQRPDGVKKGQKGQRPDGEGKDRAQNLEAKKARKTEFLSKVKTILTPEQYVQFLENNFRFPGK